MSRINNHILLSIIIPAFNSGKYIGALLELLYHQIICDENNKDKVQVIAVNDGSTDDTLSILEGYREKFGEVLSIINQENKGVSAARNHGLEEAKGAYVYFLDSDDELTDGAIEFYLNALTAGDGKNDMLSFGYVSDEGGKITNYYYDEFDGRTFDNKEVNRLYLSKRINFHIGSTIFLRDFLDRTGIRFSEGIAIGEDIEFLLKNLSETKSLKYFSHVCFRYMIHSDSAMQGYRSYSLAQFSSMELNIKTVAAVQKDKSLEKYYNFFLANSYVSNLRYYLRSTTKSNEINEGFMRYNYLLHRPISSGDQKRYVLFKLLRLVPVSWLLRKKK